MYGRDREIDDVQDDVGPHVGLRAT